MVHFVIFAGCLENGDIVLFGLHEYSQIISYSKCTPDISAKGRNYHQILKNCGEGEVHTLFNVKQLNTSSLIVLYTLCVILITDSL